MADRVTYPKTRHTFTLDSSGFQARPHLELRQGVGVVSQAQGVEGLPGVEGVQALAGRPAVDAVTLDQAHQDNLRVQVGVEARVSPALPVITKPGLMGAKKGSIVYRPPPVPFTHTRVGECPGCQRPR